MIDDIIRKEDTNMEIHSIGISWQHESGFYISRPTGSGDNLLIIFKTPAFIELNGVRTHVVPDNAIVFSKGFRQLYGSDGGWYVNHCLHMDIEGDAEFMRRSGLTMDVVFPLISIESVEELMKAINRELFKNTQRGVDTALILLQLLLYKLGESCEAYLDSNGSYERSYHYLAFENLRAEIYSNPAGKISVEQLANKMNLSVPHFQRLYKQCFGVSSYEDVIQARIRLAEQYLRTTHIEVGKIAELCGYDNYEHFARQFRQKTGFTSRGYRRQ